MAHTGTVSPVPSPPARPARAPVEVTLEEGELEAILAHPLVRALLEHGSDGVVVIDVETREIIAMNGRARDLLGYGAERVEGRRCRSTVNSPDCGRICLVDAALRAPEAGASAEVLYRGRDRQREVHAETRVIIVRAPDGRPIAGIELFRDVTPIRALERKLGERRSLAGIIGRSPPMQELYNLVEQVAPFDVPVLITGESGVGKERFADAIQSLSARSDGPYVKVNCAAITPSLIESELFGHRRGAFTGAVRDRRGSFEEADGGTILLDEVGELPLELQPKLLRVLQEGEVQRVGDDRPRRVDVRVIAATNADIEKLVEQGRFREDLYYRLAGVRLHVPPLRERLDDIPLLVEHFLERFEREAAERRRPHRVAGLADEAMDWLMAQPWRGNVRELENVLRLGFIRTPDGRPIGVAQLRPPGGPPVPTGSGRLADLEARAIRAALQRTGGNVSAAAELLGVHRTTLWRKLKRMEREGEA